MHLLATPALDRYRGYVGQSRSIQPTHTWNTTRTVAGEPGDHGGRLMHAYGSTAEEIAAALARAQPKTFAAVDDPYLHERHARAEQAEHRARLDQRPPDAGDKLRRAEQAVAAGERDLHDAKSHLANWQERREQTAGVRGFTRARRDQHHRAQAEVRFQAGVVEREQQRLETARQQQEQLVTQQAAVDEFDRANQWRHERIAALDHQLRDHWTHAVVDAASDGYPDAYGKQMLHLARQTLVERIETLGDRPATLDSIADPVKALADLDRAVHQAAERPAIQLVEPAKPKKIPARQHMGIHYQNMLYQQLQPTAPSPSARIDL